MFVGELEYADFPFQPNVIWNYLTFVLFVFLVLLVMMNLLTGVALLDGQEIMNKSRDQTWNEIMLNINFLELIAISFGLQDRLRVFHLGHKFKVFPNFNGIKKLEIGIVINEVSIAEIAHETILGRMREEEEKAFQAIN